MKKFLPVFLFFSFCLFFIAPAQDYSTGIGLRIGSANGLTVKQYVGYSTAVEGLLVYRRGGFRAIALVEQHFSLGRRTNTYLYVGAGGHYGYNHLIVGDLDPSRAYGVDFIVGLEYVFPHSGISVSLDVKPMFELNGRTSFSGNNAGASLRFLLD